MTIVIVDAGHDAQGARRDALKQLNDLDTRTIGKPKINQGDVRSRRCARTHGQRLTRLTQRTGGTHGDPGKAAVQRG